MASTDMRIGSLTPSLLDTSVGLSRICRASVPCPSHQRYLSDILSRSCGEADLDSKVGDNDAVLRIGAPHVEELAGNAALKHGRSGQHHARPPLAESAQALQVAHILEAERIANLLDRELSPRGEVNRKLYAT